MTYLEFIQKIPQIIGLDLDSYKERQMERRIRQLLQRKNLDFKSFYEELAGNEKAKEEFLKYLTINTSAFFRDEHIYSHLAEKAVKNLLEAHDRINIWSAGCSTGEEPYTLSIILHEAGAGRRSRILAGDIDTGALEKAVRGCYEPRQLEKVPPKLIKKYFDCREGKYYFRDCYKQIITFQQQNLLEEFNSSTGPLQLILCRNVFIYFKADVQEELIERFSALLSAEGYLVTGCTEMINQPQRFGLERIIPAVYKKTAPALSEQKGRNSSPVKERAGQF